MSRDRSGTGLSARLLLAQGLLLLGGAGTAWVVASAVGPGIFHAHLLEAGVGHTSAEATHVERAFSSALLLALSVALLASLVIALGVTAWFSRRVQRSTAAVAESARRISLGQYQTKVPSVGLGAEFDQLAGTINALAHRLDAVETTRRRLLADLAHEMRTPLASIEAHLEAVEDGVRDLDADTLAVLHASTARLQRLAEDVTTVSRVEEGRLELRRSPVSRASSPRPRSPQRPSPMTPKGWRSRSGGPLGSGSTPTRTGWVRSSPTCSPTPCATRHPGAG